MPINDDKLCVLKQNKNDNQISLTYEPIEIQLKDDLEELYTRLSDANNSNAGIFNYIKNHPTLKILFKSFNFCSLLSNSYEGLYEDISEIEKKFSNPAYSKSDLLKFCKKRALAYSIDQAYIKCENDNSILAYSHRRVGWSSRPYQLNENFSIQFLTNFGYGWSSYFFTKLKYKDIEIVPISEWIFYRYAQLSEVIEASAIHSVDNESWKQAMEYGQKACNLFVRNETEFVNQYIKQECDKLISGLLTIKSYSKFTFRKNYDRFNPSVEEIIMSGSELIAFRGDKISGSLYFIESIINFESVISITNYIKSIETLNKEILPVLEKEVEKISIMLPFLSIELLELERKYDELKLKNEEYDIDKSKLKEELELLEDFQSKSYYERIELLDDNFLAIKPEYINFPSQIEKAKEKYYELDNRINLLKDNSRSIEKSKEIIIRYFEGISSNN